MYPQYVYQPVQHQQQQQQQVPQQQHHVPYYQPPQLPSMSLPPNQAHQHQQQGMMYGQFSSASHSGGVDNALPMPMYPPHLSDGNLSMMHHNHNQKRMGEAPPNFMAQHPVDRHPGTNFHRAPPQSTAPHFSPPKVNSKGQSTILSTDNLIVRNLEKSITTEELRGFYSAFGAIRSCEVRRSHQTGESQGYGFVQFAEDRAAQKALDATKGKMLKGLTLNIRFAYAHADPLPLPEETTRIAIGGVPSGVDVDLVLEFIKRAGSCAPKNCLQVCTEFTPTVRFGDVPSNSADLDSLIFDVQTPAMAQFIVDNYNLQNASFPIKSSSTAPITISADSSVGQQEAQVVSGVLQIKLCETHAQMMQQRQRRKQMKEGAAAAAKGSPAGPTNQNNTSLSSLSGVLHPIPSLPHVDSGAFEGTPPFSHAPTPAHFNHRNSFASSCNSNIISSSPLGGATHADPARGTENPLFYILEGKGELPPLEVVQQAQKQIGHSHSLSANASGSMGGESSAAYTSSAGTDSSRKQFLRSRLNRATALFDALPDDATGLHSIETAIEFLCSVVSDALPSGATPLVKPS